MGEPISFLGLDFRPRSAEMLARELAAERTPRASFGYVVTPNVDHMVRLDAEPSLKELYTNADIVVNDSRILGLLAKRSGLDMVASPGADIVAELFRKHIAPGEPVNLIGGTFAVMHQLRTRFGLTNINWHQPPMGLRNKPQAIAECATFMAEQPARFHFLAVGSPQQEMIAWAAKLRGDVQGWGICCGASLDFLAGVTKRAPEWMRGAGLEWFYRMASEPSRLGKRYLVHGPRILSIWRRWDKERQAPNEPDGTASPTRGQ